MSASKILKEIKEKDVKYVDFRFTVTRGKLQHVTLDVDLVDEDFLNEGTMFDGSSIACWNWMRRPPAWIAASCCWPCWRYPKAWHWTAMARCWALRWCAASAMAA